MTVIMAVIDVIVVRWLMVGVVAGVSDNVVVVAVVVGCWWGWWYPLTVGVV